MAKERQNTTGIWGWYLKQARRLGIPRAEIEAAVLRGWCGDWIADLSATDVELLAGKAIDPQAIEGLKRVKAAPVQPVQRRLKT